MQFKCQNQPKCDQKNTYENYAKHYQECEAGQCDNEDCKKRVKELHT
jgi:hypothetical protein